MAKKIKMAHFQFAPSHVLPSQKIHNPTFPRRKLRHPEKEGPAYPNSLQIHTPVCDKGKAHRISFPQLIIASSHCFMLKRALAITTVTAWRQIKQPTLFYTAAATNILNHTLIRAGIVDGMAHFASIDKRDENDQEQGKNDEQEDYIALDCSDPESDIEIDLTTKPPSSKALRKAPKVPKHFRKSNAKVYDNISVYAPPDSNLIFRCSQKRANWYLSRNLARQLSPTSIHLNFAPAGQGHVNDPYYLEERENKCVICGQETADAGATMLHVVPEQYRKWFPLRLKSHSSHDVVVACPECNAQWDREAAVVRKKIVNLYKVPLEGVGWVRDHEAGVAKRSAGAVITEWNRRWQEANDQQQRQLTTESKDGLATPAAATEVAGSIINIVDANEEKVTQETSSLESSGQDPEGRKKTKVKKQNVIPPERLQVLEKNVYDWWSSFHGKVMDISEGSSSQQKRDLPSDFAKESLDNGQEITKKMKPEIAAQMISQPLSSSSSSSSSETKVPDNQGSVKRKEADEKVPLPPPGHTSVLNSAILEAALGAQANYKGEDYKEHGQLVIARVMATSPEYHQDAEESQETILTWREAEPLKGAPKGWRNIEEFIRTWRSEFLDRVRPKHLSTEWRVENPV